MGDERDAGRACGRDVADRLLEPVAGEERGIAVIEIPRRRGRRGPGIVHDGALDLEVVADLRQPVEPFGKVGVEAMHEDDGSARGIAVLAHGLGKACAEVAGIGKLHRARGHEVERGIGFGAGWRPVDLAHDAVGGDRDVVAGIVLVQRAFLAGGARQIVLGARGDDEDRLGRGAAGGVGPDGERAARRAGSRKEKDEEEGEAKGCVHDRSPHVGRPCHVARGPARGRACLIGAQAAARRASTRAIVSPMAEGFGATVMPAADRISTFSCALSPKAEMIAPAWPILRPFGAERPAI